MASNFKLDNNDLEIFTLIWLDAEVNGPENKQTQNDFRQLSIDFKTFDSIYDCELYIESLSIDTRIVLIVSGRLGREMVPRIHEIKQIHLIYVYCFDRKGNLGWTKNYSKIKDVLTEKKDLIKQIRNDNKKEIYQINNESLYINIYTNKSDDQFIYSQLLIDYLLKMKINSIIDKQFFTLCEIEYDENNLELKILEEFQQNNSSENSLDLLIKDKFLSKLLTKAFNRKNINLLYLFRFYIRNIHQQLELHKCLTSINVYYSYLITDEEFEQLKNSIGKFISINTFLLTTFQYDKAFLALKQANNSKKILFEIFADPSIDDIKLFADIKSFNSSINQSQILFMLGSIFHIEKLSQQDDIWICQMNLSSRNHPDLKNIFERIKEEDGDSETDLLSFGNFLARIGQHDDAEKYYKHVLNELPSNHEDIHVVYRNLGNVAYIKNDYDKSLEYHLKSLEIQKRLFKSDDSNIANSYNCLGVVYFNKNNYKQAINSYEKALNILNLTLENNHTKIATCLNNIGLVYRTEKNYFKALDSYRKVLDIEKKYLSENHSDLGQTYHNIGALYWCCGFYDNAMEYYNLSLENKYQYLPSQHISIAMTLENIGLIHENKNNIQEALKYYKEAAIIYRHTLSPVHSDVLQIENNISRALSHLK
ncbi:unnamed protein product [Rotaria sordida]|uniref:Uncharacterized protein n=1 Tax=Rotaria sordida TaxID=392033 RepID=A0A815SJD0_9BILA|nr:unnamed protein product [Rotaria sordida]CAF1493286.1 unnamed protein product [Rotaria sordida]